MHVCMVLCVYVCACVYMCMCVHACVYVCMCVHACVYVCACMCVCVCMHVCVCVGSAVSDLCATGDHDCEQVCISAPGSFKCACREGQTLMEDGRSCSGEFMCFCVYVHV